MTEHRSFTPADTERAKEMSAVEAISYHYDNDTRFFSLWLDPTLSYSSARWRPVANGSTTDDLASAQRAKLDFHLDAAAVPAGGSLIDIGCGWGAILKGALDRGAASAVGLTLSEDQKDFIVAQNWSGAEVRLEDVFAYETDQTFDGAVSIGAFEHFARPEMTREEKISTYRDFFARMHSILKPNARFSLQTIVWDALTFDEARTWIAATPQTVFPRCNVPFIAEVAESSAEHFRLVYLENDPRQYAMTLSAWIKNLRGARETVIENWGEEKYRFFENYLRLSRLAFQSRELSLARFILQRR